jgi:single-strand DNA-binding protein
MINKVTLIGNVGQDIELRSMQNGNKVVNISLATSESWKDKNGEKKEAVEWHKVVVYGDKLPEMLAKYAKKGSKLFVEGSIKSRKYNDSTGAERRSFEIVVQGYGSTVKILDSRDSGSSASQGSDDFDRIDSGNSNSYDSNDRIDSSVKIDDEIPF